MAYKTIQTQTLVVARADSIKRGFVRHFVDFIAKRGHATVAELQAKFTGRQFNRKRQGKHTIDRFNPQWVCRFHYDRWNADRARFLADRLGCQMEEL